MMRRVVDFDVRSIGNAMPRTRYQRGTLRTSVPRHGGRPERKLPRGQYWAQWYQYVRQPDGSEKRKQREKIITRELAELHHIAKDYVGPLTKSDAQRVLDLLIAQDAGTCVRSDTKPTLAMIAKDYLALAEPNWGPHMVRTAGNLVRKHICAGTLGTSPIAELTETDLQRWLNQYVSSGVSRSLLSGLLLHIRAVWKLARKKRVVTENATEDLRARSKKQVCGRSLTLDECRRLLSVLIGRDLLIVRMFIQLGLRPEEMFALRRDDVHADALRVDEAMIEGQPGPVKTAASAAFVYIPPDLEVELNNWLQSSDGQPSDWLFQTAHGRAGHLNSNNFRNRVLKPAAKRAGIDGVNFQTLRRTCATLFGDKAKDPKSTQAQLRHADPTITLKHYQKAVPASVKAAAVALEADLIAKNTEGVLRGRETQ